MAQEFPTNVKPLETIDPLYQKINWQNGITQLNAENLNVSEDGLDKLFGHNDSIVPQLIDTLNKEIAARIDDTTVLKERADETQWVITDLEKTHAGLISFLQSDVNELNKTKVDTGTISHASETKQEGVTKNGTSLDIVVNAYTKEEVNTKVSELQQASQQLLNNKVDTGTIAHTSAEVSEGVTTSGTSLNIVIDAYTKSETDNKIAEAVKNVSGETSAASVKAELDEYKSQTNTNLNSININIDEIESSVSGVDQRVTVLETTVNNIPKDVVRTSHKLILRCGSATENLFQAQ